MTTGVEARVSTSTNSLRAPRRAGPSGLPLERCQEPATPRRPISLLGSVPAVRSPAQRAEHEAWEVARDEEQKKLSVAPPSSTARAIPTRLSRSLSAQEDDDEE